MNESIYAEYKDLLLSVAYRLLGSNTEAEDIVHEVMIRVGQVDLKQITNLKSYLIKAVTNSSLNYLKSAKVKREQYTGSWLPEPDIRYVDQTEQNPTDILLQKEEISYALLVSLEQLNPIERAIFILREVFGYEYKEIANLLDKTDTGCRQMLSRSKKRLKVDQMKRNVSIAEEEHFIQAFLHGSKKGNFDEFIHLLTEQATLTMDGGGKVRSALRPILGRKNIMAFFKGVSSKGALAGEFTIVNVNGQRGILLTRDGSAIMVICFKINLENMIEHIFAISNPDKLSI